ncbi:MAG: hypothetical protein K2W96_18645 [Gemmataceae bacterium]|nr:hypothetical protein [Gemmataceae bacterium]
MSASVALLLAVAACACDGGKPAEKDKGKGKDARSVSVCVVAILASEKDDAVDPELKAIAKEVRKMRPGLKGFKKAKLSCRSIKVGASGDFELVEGKKAGVTINEAADKMDRVRLKVDPPGMGVIAYSTPCGKFLPILTPFKTKSGDQLLIAIRVRPCNGK